MADAKLNHEVTFVAGGQVIANWLEYSITNSLLDPADQFMFKVPWSQEAWDLLVPDASVRWLAPATSTSAASIGLCAART